MYGQASSQPWKAFPDGEKISRTLVEPPEGFGRLFRDPVKSARDLGRLAEGSGGVCPASWKASRSAGKSCPESEESRRGFGRHFPILAPRGVNTHNAATSICLSTIIRRNPRHGEISKNRKEATVSGQPGGKQFMFRVVAIGKAGEGEPSKWAVGGVVRACVYWEEASDEFPGNREQGHQA